MEIYVVKSGDNVDSIAGAYGVSVESIIYDLSLIHIYLPLSLRKILYILRLVTNSIRKAMLHQLRIKTGRNCLLIW